MADESQGLAYDQNPPQQGGTIPWDDAPAPSVNNPQVIDNRVKKHDYGLQESSPGPAQLKSDIITGNERRARANSAASQDLKDLASRTQLMQQITAQHPRGEGISDQELEAVKSLTPGEVQNYRNNPDTFYEKMFARRVTQNVQDMAEEKQNVQDMFQQAATAEIASPSNNPQYKAAENIITRQQAFQGLLESQEAKWSEESLGSKFLDIGGQMIPFLAAQHLQTALKDITSSVFPGQVTRDAVDYLWSLPEDQALAKAKEIITKLEDVNPALAVDFARHLVKYSTSDQFLDNSGLFADLATATSPFIKAGMKTTQVGVALKDLVKSTATRTFKDYTVPEAAGRFDISAPSQAVDIARNRITQVGNPQNFADIQDAVPSGFSPYTAVNGYLGPGGTERARRILGVLETNDVHLGELLGDKSPVSIDRLTKGGTAYKEAIRFTDEIFNKQFPNVTDSIIGIRTIDQSDNAIHGLYRAYQIGPEKGMYVPIAREAKLTQAGQQPLSIQQIEGLGPWVIGRPFELKDLTPANDHMFVQLGEKDATLFESAEAATRAAKEDYGLQGFFVRQKGTGYFIEYHKAVNEAAVSVSEALAQETEFSTPRGTMSWVLQGVGAGTKRVSPDIEKDMYTATYGSTGLAKLMESAAQPIRDLKGSHFGKSSYKDLLAYAERQQTMKHPETGDIGYFDHDLMGFEKHWYDQFQRLPTDKEAAAYFAHTWLSDTDYLLRNMQLTKEKVRLGLEQHGFAYLGQDAEGNAAKVVPKAAIEGRVVKEIPFDRPLKPNEPGAGVLVWNQDLTKLAKGLAKEDDAGYFNTKFAPKGWTLGSRKEYIQDLVDNKGYRIVQLSNIGEQALRDSPHLRNAAGESLLPKSKIHYVVTPDLSSEPLTWKQFPYKPGGHVEYPNGWFVSQPSVRVFGEGRAKMATYYGDNHYMYRPTEREVKDFTERANIAQRMLREGNPLFEDYYTRNLPGKADHFKNLFDKENGLFDIDTPFFAKASNQDLATAHDLQEYYKTNHGASFRRSSDDPFDIYGNNISLKFLGERNQTLRSFTRTGDVETPAYHFRKTNLVDPITSVTRGFQQLVRDQYLGDLKIKTARSFVEEFGSLLKHPDGLEGLRRNPMAALVDPVWRSDIYGDDRALMQAARNFRRTAVNFMGLQSEFSADTRYRMADMFRSLSGIGDTKLGRMANDYVEPWLLHRVGNPNTLFKNVAFHSLLGLLSPVSWSLHLVNVANAMMIAGPLQGPQAAAKAFLMRGLMLSESPMLEKVMPGVAKWAKDWGSDPSHFQESFEAFKRTGFSAVGGEHAMRDTYFDTPMVFNRGRKFLDATSSIFNEGASWSRYVGWSASYDKWRAANPLAKFDDQAIASVLQRANVLSGDMSRASKAAWQQGFLSVPTQFLSWQARLLEQFWGRDLSWAERSRVFVGMSALFGVPAGMGIPVGVWPIHKEVDAALRNAGIDEDSNTALRIVNSGAASFIAQAIAGAKQDTKNRFAAGGTDVFRDIYKGKKSVQETLGGPSGIFGLMQEQSGRFLPYDITKTFLSAASAVSDYIPAIMEGRQLPNSAVTVQKIIDFTNNTGVGNAARKFYMMQSFGKFVSKNEETILSDQTSRQAWVSFLTGAQPQKVTDTYAMIADNETRRRYQQLESTQAKKWMRLAFESPSKEDSDKYLLEAQLHIEAGDFNAREKLQLMKQLTAGREDKYLQVLHAWSLQDSKHMEYGLQKLQNESKH